MTGTADDPAVPGGPRLARTRDELRFALAETVPSGPLLLVPTMGALHAGHASLIEEAERMRALLVSRPRARSESEEENAGGVVVSIFVNPTQFGPGEDLDRYPRTLDADLELCAKAGAKVVFAPTAEEMYPGGFATAVRVGGPLTDTLEGAHRPGHFDGVATVVLKLLNVVRPDVAVFGEKDFQQLAVVRQMVTDLNLPYLIESVPTVREDDGLALSSRNRYLSPEQRTTAAELPAALFAARDAIQSGEPAATVERRLAKRLTTAGFAVDYAAVRCPTTLGPPPKQPPFSVRILVAAKLGDTRLIDNVVATRMA